MIVPPSTAATLVLLALTDSLSFGTLLVPVWLLMASGPAQVRKLLTYLATVAAAYFLIGVAVMMGGRPLIEQLTGLLDTMPALVAQGILGIFLVAASTVLDTKTWRTRAANRGRNTRRLHRWRDRILKSPGNNTVATLAFAAVAVELASMLPYLAATNIIAAQATTWPSALTVLAGYCLVMLAPATALLGGRLFAPALIQQPLEQLDTWLTRNARSTTLWIVGIAGVILAATAIQSLGWIPAPTDNPLK